MLPLELQSPAEIARAVADRARALRLHRRWTQRETAARAGMTLATYRRFERTGRVSFERLLKLAAVLDARGGFDQIFSMPPARSLDELEGRSRASARKRGRRADAQA